MDVDLEQTTSAHAETKPLASHPWLVRRDPVTYTAIPCPVSLPVPIPATSSPSLTAGLIPALINVVVRTTSPQLSTPVNVFGLSRHYYATNFPQHDPEAEVALIDLTDNTSDIPLSADMLQPYPNLNSLLLGDWYWGDGQKSIQDFKNLIDIVGNNSFRPEDVCATPWEKINKALASNDYEKEAWIDETAGWNRSSVTISVPFHERRVSVNDRDASQIAAPRPYVVHDFRYRRLLAVIEDKLTNKKDHTHFHYEPFRLQWQPPRSNLPPMRVYSEIYTSDAFLKAHVALQASPPVPGCTLPRVIVGLMFWSDATHLASFSDTKLHPLYMSFANESKDRRAKPSERLMLHVAYFRNVSYFLYTVSGIHQIPAPE
jgi:hypothetical protein